MSIILNCPKCNQPVTVPSGASTTALVRCPLCEVQYALSEALATLPPALIVVDDPAASLAVPAAAAPEDGQLALIGEDAPAAESLSVTEPAIAGEHALGGDHDFLIGEETPAKSDGEPAAETEEDHWAGAWTKPEEGKDEETVDFKEEGESDTIAVEGDEESDASVFGAITGKRPPGQGAPPPLPGGAAGAAELPALPKKRRRRREPHPVRVGIGMVMSGLLAVAVFYYGANFFGGEQYDKWGIYLPGVPHTYKHWKGAAAANQTKPDSAKKPAAANAKTLPDLPAVNHGAAAAAQPADNQVAVKPAKHEAAPPPPDLSEPEKKDEPEPAGKADKSKAKEDQEDEPDLTSGFPVPPKATPAAPIAKPVNVAPQPQTPQPPTEVKPAPKPEEKAAPKPEVKPETKPETPTQSKTEPKPEAPSQSKTDVAPDFAPVAESVGPRNPPSYAAAEFAKVVKTAGDTFKSADVTPEAYESLREVAQVFTFMSPADGDPMKHTLEDLLKNVATEPAQADKIAQRAVALLTAGDSKGGIIITGVVTVVGVKGGLHGAAVRMAGMPKPVSVMSAQSLPIAKDDKVLILGSIIRDPAKNLAGYTGTQPVVVWAAMAIKLPQ